MLADIMAKLAGRQNPRSRRSYAPSSDLEQLEQGYKRKGIGNDRPRPM